MIESPALSQHGLELLVEVSRTLLEESNLKLLLPRLLDRAFEVSRAERGYILLRNAKGELYPVQARSIEPGSLPPGDPSTSVIERALKERRTVLSRNASRDPRFGGSSSLIIRGIRSACCVPLEARGERLGALYLDATGSGVLTEADLPLLDAFGLLAGLALGRVLDMSRRAEAFEEIVGRPKFAGIVGESPVMQRLYERMERIATADLPVLIVGESGTGKELVARALHQVGRRASGPMRAIFCGNLTADLLESELFGYKRGAFTGAIADKPGLLDLTDKGTLFLDEIADVPPIIQAKLLRFLQEGEYQRLGDPAIRHSDTRILSATNKSLEGEIAAGRFREDLYYRLNVLRIEVPPLRTREGDLALLSAYTLARIAHRTGQPPRRLSAASLSRLQSYDWPGNVRELENVLARAAVLAAGDIIEPEEIDLPKGDRLDQSLAHEQASLDEAIKAHILKVLQSVGGNRSEAARILGVSRRYLQKSLVRWRGDEDDDVEDDPDDDDGNCDLRDTPERA
ncbi:MAG: sigma-54-dependent Fis family transcriptional regulator [Calditrichaeota bacterium]|nr:sigma-54-dependent Fis family transcriptional regulator [Calditrichota bacterium]